ncbi:hydantoinase/oxoprolinase family protein [Caldinitratiruptor microaerophilus]|uniref:Methylhydantoinase n=1 Tax=Caldinitratiruptor microaerophilus TaxID=671077 RepID=A0AA35G7P6_9FIRM|nr:hydantoinase/oxoprolinase family protein [Caldinitratiruptor microaerophilus]BDG59538.1 methylhydantoinase [Caldinitratiruptor microaerophilus]
MQVRVGVDVGGTFTDVSLFDPDSGTVHVFKLLSTPHDQSVAIVDGIRAILDQAGASPADVVYLAHGTTVATNALLEHKGARVGLITTRGFADLLDIGRQKRPSLYDLFADKPPAIVPRYLREEVAERLRSDGTVLVPLDPDEVEAAVESLARRGIEALAICFLHAYRNPEHEARARDVAEGTAPHLYVSASHEVAPEFREYERFSTTVINAYLGPVMSRYIKNLGDRVRDLGVAVEPFVTQSNGGIISLRTVQDNPVRTALSGPSAGVVGASYVARTAGFEDIITFDMGGTSTDVCLVKSGTPTVSSQRSISGYPIRVPMVDIHTIGAGGGSIAWIDPAGALRVGPESAGARPGPAAYGLGGDRATVTDANVVLGRLNPRYLLGGRVAIDYAAAERAVGRLAQGLGVPAVEAAMGVLRVVNSNMARAIRAVSVDKGEDPRSYVLLAFGGAGPVHAAELAAELGMSTVLVPTRPGILCAMGLLATDLRSDYVRSRVLPAVPEAVPEVNRVFAEMEALAGDWLDREGVPPEKRRFVRSVDMRYSRQNHELPVAVPDGEFTVQVLEQVVGDFHLGHEKNYGFADPSSPVHFVNFRLVAMGDAPKLPIAALAKGTGTPPPDAVLERRPVFFPAAGDYVETPVYARDHLRAGDRFEGPAIVEQLDTTTVVPPGCAVTVDAYGNLVVEVGRA